MQTVYELGKLKSHDKEMAALCVCCGELKSTFHSFSVSEDKNVFVNRAVGPIATIGPFAHCTAGRPRDFAIAMGQMHS